MIWWHMSIIANILIHYYSPYGPCQPSTKLWLDLVGKYDNRIFESGCTLSYLQPLPPNNCLPRVSYQFDESYASRGHNGKKTCFFTHRRFRTSQKTFSAASSLGCTNMGLRKALGTSQLVLIKSPGTSCCQINQCSRWKHTVQRHTNPSRGTG